MRAQGAGRADERARDGGVGRGVFASAAGAGGKARTQDRPERAGGRRRDGAVAGLPGAH